VQIYWLLLFIIQFSLTQRQIHAYHLFIFNFLEYIEDILYLFIFSINFQISIQLLFHDNYTLMYHGNLLKSIK